jgi:hypothetical protein
VIFLVQNDVKIAKDPSRTRIVLLHHSTGQLVWDGGRPGISTRLRRKLARKFGWKTDGGGLVPTLFVQYNRQRGTHYEAEELIFPKAKLYGWRNYPFDYYTIWVKNASPRTFLEEPTLELLTQEYQIIIFKHCFPVSNIQPDQGVDINSDYRSLANYRLQYLALREKIHEFPKTKFIVWTGAAQVENHTNEEEAKRAREFFNWVLTEWDLPNDNIFIWDFYGLQTAGELYFRSELAQSKADSHPNSRFSKSAAKLLVQRTVDVIESGGANTSPTGAWKGALPSAPGA